MGSEEKRRCIGDNQTTPFYGGHERGPMIQITGKDGFVQFTKKEAVELIDALQEFCNEKPAQKRAED